MSEPLRVAADNCIITAKNRLIVLNRRGAFTLQNNGIDRLYHALEALLDGLRVERQVIEAFPPASVPSVRILLQKLHEAGALSTQSLGAEDAGISLTALEKAFQGALHRRSAATVAIGQRRMFLALKGTAKCQAAGYIFHLFFVTEAQIRKVLLALRGPAVSTAYVVDPPADAVSASGQSRQKLMIAQWLMNLQPIVPSSPPLLQIYIKQPGGIRINELLKIRRSSPLRPIAVAEHLDLVKHAPVKQIPLVCLIAQHPLFSPRLFRFGLDFAVVRADLLREFLVRCRFAEYEDSAAIPFRTDDGRDPSFPCSEVRSWPVAGSLSALRAKAIEAWAEEHARPASAPVEVDVLVGGGLHPDSSYLRSALRLRIPTLVATYFTTAQGLHVYERDGLRCASLLKQKAERDFLLRAVIRIFYPETGVLRSLAETEDFCVFCSPAEMRSLVTRIEFSLQDSGQYTYFAYRRMKGFALTGWTGAFRVE